MKSQGISKRQRLRDSREFARVFDKQQRVANRRLLVFAARNDLGWTRFGLVVSKKHGNAVRRVRLKRLLREAFRLTQHDLPQGLDLILIPQRNTDAGLSDFRQALLQAVEKLARRLAAC